jgi:hypothetical protein
MKPRQFAEHLRKSGFTKSAIQAFVRAVYGEHVSIETLDYWLRPKRRESIREYMREWMRKHREAAKRPGKPVVDRNRFDIEGPLA